MDAPTQILLQMAYRDHVREGKPLPPISDVGFKVFSQTDEDGILLYLFSIIGTGSKTCVEICAGNGIECNCANLIIHHGWTGLLVDGNDKFVRQGIEFYSKHPATFVYPPTFAHAWITRDNVNSLLESHGFGGEIDLLSLDLDGVDYWIWEAITVVQPRVVVVEYQDILGPDRALTVPYSDEFNGWAGPMTGSTPNYFGASLAAFVKLARRKGYRLVGSNRLGYNAFFVRAGFGEKELPEIPVSDCFRHRKVSEGIRDRFPSIKDHAWVEV